MKVRYVPIANVQHPETRGIVLEKMTAYKAQELREIMDDMGIDNVPCFIIQGDDDAGLQRAYAQALDAINQAF